MEELESITENFVRGGKALVDLEPIGKVSAGPADAFSLDVAAARLVDNTVNDIIRFLRSRFRNFNENKVRNALVLWLTRKMHELG